MSVVENGPRISRRALLKLGVLGAGAVAFAGVACDGEQAETAKLPEGFTRNITDYEFKTILDKGQGISVVFYSKERPTEEISGGLSHIEVNNIYCPDWSAESKKQFGCEEFVVGKYTHTNSKRITIVPNPEFTK